MKRFIKYYKPHWKLFTIDMICSFLISLCTFAYPFVTELIMDKENIQAGKFDIILIWCSVLIGIYIAKSILNYIVQYWGHILGIRMQADMRKELFEHLQSLPFSYFDENKTGTIMSRLINDLQDISELAHHGPEDIFIATITLIGSCVLMIFSVNPYLALISFSVVPIIVIYAIITRKNMRNAFKKTREEKSV